MAGVARRTLYLPTGDEECRSMRPGWLVPSSPCRRRSTYCSGQSFLEIHVGCRSKGNGRDPRIGGLTRSTPLVRRDEECATPFLA